MKAQHRHKGIPLVCVECKEDFHYIPTGPLAVTCPLCGALFDARLQLVKEYVKDFLDATK